MSILKRLTPSFFLLAACLISFLVAMQVGSAEQDVWRLWLSSVLSADMDAVGELSGQILWQIRAPRALTALLVGASLGLAGAAIQGLLRNPLAEPGIIGVSGGAALFSVLVLYLGLVSAVSWWLPVAAIAGSALGLTLVLLLAGLQSTQQTLILAGVACSAMFASGIALVLNLAPNPFAMQELSFWLMGSVAFSDWHQVRLLAPFLLLGVGLTAFGGNYLRALSLGEETAQSLGYSTPKYRLVILAGVALLVGSAVAVSGIIGFVGLMAPHLVRRWVQGDPRSVLPTAALAGALLLSLADIFVQLLSEQAPLQLGVVTGLLGGPFFLILLLRHRWHLR